MKDLLNEWEKRHELTTGHKFSTILGMMTGNKYIDRLANNPIPEGPKNDISGKKVCSNPSCYNHHNLKACGRCRKLTTAVRIAKSSIGLFTRLRLLFLKY